MNAKTDAPAARKSSTCRIVLDAWLGAGAARVILPITDPYVVHHGALGSFATIYLPTAPTSQALARASPRCPASRSCYRATRRAARFELPPDRMGDLVVISERHTVSRHRATPPRSLGPRRAAALARRHHRAAGAAARSTAVRRAGAQASRLRNFDVFDLALNQVI